MPLERGPEFPANDGTASNGQPVEHHATGAAPSDPDAPTPNTITMTRYCKYCGAPWQTGWTACPGCAARSTSPAYLPTVDGPSAKPIVSALCLYFALLLTSLVAIISEENVHTDLCLEAVDAAIVLIWAAVGWRHLLPVLRTLGPVKWYAASLGMAVASFICASLAAASLVDLLDIPEILYLDRFFEEGYGWSMVLVSICVQPAVIEELAFRGIIYNGLGRILNPREVILVSAVLFMVIHLSVASFPHLLLLGLALGYVRWRSGSVYPCMLLHCTHNLLCVVTERLPG